MGAVFSAIDTKLNGDALHCVKPVEQRRKELRQRATPQYANQY